MYKLTAQLIRSRVSGEASSCQTSPGRAAGTERVLRRREFERGAGGLFRFACQAGVSAGFFFFFPFDLIASIAGF